MSYGGTSCVRSTMRASGAMPSITPLQAATAPSLIPKSVRKRTIAASPRGVSLVHPVATTNERTTSPRSARLKACLRASPRARGRCETSSSQHESSCVSVRVDLLGFRNHRIRLDLDEPVGIDEARHLHDGVRRTNIAEDLAVGERDRLPVLDAGEQDSRADDVRERCACRLERAPDDLQTSPRLGPRVTHPDGAAVRT